MRNWERFYNDIAGLLETDDNYFLGSFKEKYFLEDSDVPVLTPGRKDAFAYNELLKLDGLFKLNCTGKIREAYDYFSKKLGSPEMGTPQELLLRQGQQRTL